MNNGERELDQFIANIENELTALKTAHERPLGALDFFHGYNSFSVDLTSSYGVYAATINVVVKIAVPSVTPPIVQTGWDTPSGFYQVNFLEFTTSANYSTWIYKLQLIAPGTVITSATMKIGVISSQPIESITWSYA